MLYTNHRKFLEELAEDAKKEEGLRLLPYRDSLGFWTLGFGHKLQDNPITESAAIHILRDDIEEAYNEARNIVMPRLKKVPSVIMYVITAMVFQMGTSRVLKFEKMWAAFEKRDWDKFCKEMLDSKWARRDTPERARRLEQRIRTAMKDKRGLL